MGRWHELHTGNIIDDDMVRTEFKPNLYLLLSVSFIKSRVVSTHFQESLEWLLQILLHPKVLQQMWYENQNFLPLRSRLILGALLIQTDDQLFYCRVSQVVSVQEASVQTPCQIFQAMLFDILIVYFHFLILGTWKLLCPPICLQGRRNKCPRQWL